METVRNTNNIEESGSLWHKCPKCGEVSFHRELERNDFICPKCKELFPLTIENRLKLLIDVNTITDNSETESNQIIRHDVSEYDAFAVEENIAEYSVSLFILSSYATLKQQHLKVFSASIECAIEKTIPLLTVFPVNDIETECTFSDIIPLLLRLDRLSQAAIPHLTVLTETDVEKLTSYLPVGEIVIAECASLPDNISRIKPQPALHAPEEQLLPEENRNLTPDISVDCYVPRPELHTILARLLSFFAAS